MTPDFHCIDQTCLDAGQWQALQIAAFYVEIRPGGACGGGSATLSVLPLSLELFNGRDMPGKVTSALKITDDDDASEVGLT
ncbi:hypothetical protein ASF69_01830 [Rhizobium sp. Leaf311]|nr:hypothetical protein ASF69_01830 [Rhizobium sp. Leaf311]